MGIGYSSSYSLLACLNWFAMYWFPRIRHTVYKGRQLPTFPMPKVDLFTIPSQYTSQQSLSLLWVWHVESHFLLKVPCRRDVHATTTCNVMQYCSCYCVYSEGFIKLYSSLRIKLHCLLHSLHKLSCVYLEIVSVNILPWTRWKWFCHRLWEISGYIWMMKLRSLKWSCV